MALIPSISPSIHTNCKKFLQTDNTGLFDDPANEGGWGDLNIDPSDITEATITIILPNSETEYTFDVTTEVSSVVLPSQYFPNYTFEITELDMSDFGGSAQDKFPDGKYTITYTLIAEETTYTCTVYHYSLCQVCCCVDKMLSDAIDSVLCNKCNTAVVEDALFAKALIQEGQKYAASYWEFDKAESLRLQAEKLCNFKNCNCP